eukprot:sb/3475382/
MITKKTETSRYHTQLAQQYLLVLERDDVDQGTGSIRERIRRKLQEHLLSSDRYAVSLILNKLEGTTELKRELAILYGKLKQYHPKKIRSRQGSNLESPAHLSHWATRPTRNRKCLKSCACTSFSTPH